MTTKQKVTQKTVKTETWTAVVTNPGTRGFQFKVTKGAATRRQVRRAMKALAKATKATKSSSK